METTRAKLLDELIELHCRIETCLVARQPAEYIASLGDKYKAVAAELSKESMPTPVSERPPEFTNRDPDDKDVVWSDEVLAYFPARGWRVAEYWYDGDWLVVNSELCATPTHWLPLPPDPE